MALFMCLHTDGAIHVSRHSQHAGKSQMTRNFIFHLYLICIDLFFDVLMFAFILIHNYIHVVCVCDLKRIRIIYTHQSIEKFHHFLQINEMKQKIWSKPGESIIWMNKKYFKAIHQKIQRIMNAKLGRQFFSSEKKNVFWDSWPCMHKYIWYHVKFKLRHQSSKIVFKVPPTMLTKLNQCIRCLHWWL